MIANSFHTFQILFVGKPLIRSVIFLLHHIYNSLLYVDRVYINLTKIHNVSYSETKYEVVF